MKIKLEIFSNKNKYLIKYHSNDVSTVIECNVAQLNNKYNITEPEQITFELVKKITNDNFGDVRKEIKFNSTVVIRKSKDKKFKFQIENNIVLITNTITNDEMFVPLSFMKPYNKSMKKFNDNAWNIIKEKRTPITPTTHNIQSNMETGFDTPVEDFFKDFNN